MKSRRFCWLGLWVPVGLFALPLVLWFAIVLVAPTKWARSQVIAALSQSSGRKVQLEGLSVCLDGRVELSGLSMGSSRSLGDPWLEAERILIDVSPFQLYRGTLEPSTVEVHGARLRILRRGDGTLELADLLSSDHERMGERSDDSKQCGLSRLRARILGSRIEIIDEPTATKVELDDVHGEGYWESPGDLVVNVTGLVNRGPFRLTAHLDNTGSAPEFEGQLRATRVVLDDGMAALRYLVPVLAGAPAQLRGELAIDLYARGEGDTREAISRSVSGHGSVALDPVQLGGTPLIAEFSRILELPEREQIGSLVSEFEIGEGRVRTDKLTIHAGRLPIHACGWTNFDGQLDYDIRVDSVTARLPEKARQIVGELELDLDALTTIRLTGSVNQVEIRMKEASAAVKTPLERLLPREDRDRLRLLGKRLREKVLR